MPDTANISQSTSITVDGITYEKHEKHWYPDGNIISTVQDTAFRLFQSFLIRRSEVMALVLTVPQPNEPMDAPSKPQEHQSMFDGVPVVRLDDLTCDFAVLLDAILPQTYASAPVSSDTPRWQLLGLAQIAQKYGVNDVVAQTVSILEDVLPTTKNLRGRYAGPEPAVRIIEWARRCSFPQFLPMAFYYATTIQWGLNNMPLRMIQHLHPRDQIRIQRGLGKLQSEVINAALTRWENSCIGTSKPEKGCPSRVRSCWVGYEGKAWNTDKNEARWTNLLLHPLEELLKRVHDRETIPLRDICEACREEFINANKRMRLDLVGKLESIFSLVEGAGESGGR
ncbi:hypothetical protein FRC04_004153 [Tulasnella sp. 424]|nr:hypothetical protein FRC04_004153 [Tulasnella sp. 424]KAG8968895.1 hypothetical protein FRC05_001263 [Tulasnella sp. 425]